MSLSSSRKPIVTAGRLERSAAAGDLPVMEKAGPANERAAMDVAIDSITRAGNRVSSC